MTIREQINQTKHRAMIIGLIGMSMCFLGAGFQTLWLFFGGMVILFPTII